MDTAYDRIQSVYREVHELYHPELSRIAGLIQDATLAADIRQLVEGLFTGDVEAIHFIAGAYRNKAFRSFEHREALLDVASKSDDALQERGIYPRGQLLTGQEHKLIGSSAGTDWEPYKPRILREVPNADMGLLNAQRKRQEGKVGTILAEYFGMTGDRIVFSLEPLDETGRTIRDPVPLDGQGNRFTTHTKSKDFPYRRN